MSNHTQCLIASILVSSLLALSAPQPAGAIEVRLSPLEAAPVAGLALRAFHQPEESPMSSGATVLTMAVLCDKPEWGEMLEQALVDELPLYHVTFLDNGNSGAMVTIRMLLARGAKGAGWLAAGDVHLNGEAYHASESSVSEASAISEFAKSMSNYIMHEFASKARIRDIDGRSIYLNRSSNSGFTPGLYCDVYNEQDVKVGVLRVVSSTESYAVAQAVRGGDNIRVGHRVETRHFAEQAGFGIAIATVPVESATGSGYQSLVSPYSAGEGGLSNLSSATMLRAAYIIQVSPMGSEVDLGGGVMSLSSGFSSLGSFGDNLYAPFFDLSTTGAVPLVFDRLSLTGTLGGGLFLVPGQEFRIDPGVFDTSRTGDSGSTRTNSQWYGWASAGMKMFLSPHVTLNLDGGYFYSGDGNDWHTRVGTGDGRRDAEIPPEYVRYDHVSVRGFRLTIGISVPLQVI